MNMKVRQFWRRTFLAFRISGDIGLARAPKSSGPSGNMPTSFVEEGRAFGNLAGDDKANDKA